MPTDLRRSRVISQRSLTRSAYHTAVPSQPKHRPFKYRAILIALLFVAFAGHSLQVKHAAAEDMAAQHAKAAAAVQAKQKAANFGSQVNQLISANATDDISVAVASDASGVQTFGEDTTFDGASTAKLLTAADYLHHVEQGTASLKHKIDGQAAQQWLKSMLVDSDDTAWAELNNYLTHQDLADYAKRIDFTNYDVANNTFTARDVALLLQKLYQGKLLNDTNRSLMLGYMSQANYRQYIVAAVPDSDKTYHKIGIDEDTVNDAAVITKGQQYVVLVIFTNGHGTYNWDARAELMQEITQAATAAYL